MRAPPVRSSSNVRVIGSVSILAGAPLRLFRFGSGRRPSSQHQHHDSEDQQHNTPSQIDIQSERTLIDRLVAKNPIDNQQQSKQSEHQADRQTYVQSHLRSSSPDVRQLQFGEFRQMSDKLQFAE